MAGLGEGPCCDAAHGLESLARELQESAADPTLSSCCQRDLEEQAAVARLKARLAAQDRTNLRKQVAERVLLHRPPAQPPQLSLDEEDLESSDEDEALARLRALRVGELKQQQAERDKLQAAGHGTLTTLPNGQLLDIAMSSSGFLVCHIAAEGCQGCDELDEHLARLAHRYMGTRFVRTLAARGSGGLLRSLGLAGPGLACFRDGALIGSAGLESFTAADEGSSSGDGGLVEEAVDSWLRGLRVLHQLAASSSTAGGGQKPEPASDEEEDEEEDSWQPACEVCGRRYPHQHIRSAYVSRAEDSSDDDDER